MTLNTVAISGSVNKKFDTRTSDKGTKNAALQLVYLSGTFKKYIYVTAFGDRAVAQIEAVNDGDEVIVQGNLNESRWKVKGEDGEVKLDKDGKEEWTGRTEVNLFSLTPIATPVAAGDDSGPWGE